MKTISQIVPVFLVCGTLAVMTAGCLGPQVLMETQVHVPAKDPKVEFHLRTNAPTDILVVYDDLSSPSDKIERKAFYLFENEDRLMRGRRPQFVRLSEVDHLKMVPMLKCPPEEPNAATNELYAVEMSSRRFRLESHGKLLSAFGLPEYERWLTAKKVFLFPGAVAADTLVVPAVVAEKNPQLATLAAEVAAIAAAEKVAGH